MKIISAAEQEHPTLELKTIGDKRRGPSNRRKQLLTVAGGLGLLLVGLVIGQAIAGQRTDREPVTASGETSVTLASARASAVPPPSSTATLGTAAGGVDELLTGLAALNLGSIEFLPGTAVITRDGEQALLRAADVIIANPAIPVEIIVHTYTESTPGINHGLSTEQADAVSGFLVANGVDESRMATTGVGSLAGGTSSTSSMLLFETSHRDLSSAISELGDLAVELTLRGALRDSSVAVLEQVAIYLSFYPEAELTLVGYAYDQGSDDANHELSHALGKAAVAYLVSVGIESEQLSTVALGDASLELDLDTVVEFEVGPAAALTLALRQIDNEAIEFELHAATLTPSARRTLDEVIAAFKVDLTRNIDIAAHTYSERTSQANHDLSHEQGESVIEHLVNGGVDPSRLLLVGHGDPPQFEKPGRDTFITFTVVH